ncbi:MAG: diguanylate cyclase [Candidatus Muiribacteriota bacterium]
MKKKCADCEYAKYDGLTRLYRKEFFKYKFSKIKSKDQPYFFCVADIDFFKKINDNYGHETGDFILKKFSEKIIDNIQKDEFAGRFGGEEFVFLLKGRTERLKSIFLNIKNTMKNLVFDEINLPSIKFSMGAVSTYLDSFKADFKNADRALYYAKQTGRNKYVLYNDMIMESPGQNIFKKPVENHFFIVIIGYNGASEKIFDKGYLFINKKLEKLKWEINKNLNVIENYIYKNTCLCSIINEADEGLLRKVFSIFKKKDPSLYGIINKYPGVTKLNYIFKDTYLAFRAHELFKENQGIVFYGLKTIRAVGVHFYKKNDFKKGYHFFRIAYFLNKTSVKEIINLTSIMIKLKKIKQAIVILKRKEQYIKDEEAFYISLSNCYHQLRLKEKVIETLFAGVKKFPESKVLKNNITEYKSKNSE